MVGTSPLVNVAGPEVSAWPKPPSGFTSERPRSFLAGGAIAMVKTGEKQPGWPGPHLSRWAGYRKVYRAKGLRLSARTTSKPYQEWKQPKKKDKAMRPQK